MLCNKRHQKTKQENNKIHKLLADRLTKRIEKPSHSAAHCGHTKNIKNNKTSKHQKASKHQKINTEEQQKTSKENMHIAARCGHTAKTIKEPFIQHGKQKALQGYAYSSQL